ERLSGAAPTLSAILHAQQEHHHRGFSGSKHLERRACAGMWLIPFSKLKCEPIMLGATCLGADLPCSPQLTRSYTLDTCAPSPPSRQTLAACGDDRKARSH